MTPEDLKAVETFLDSAQGQAEQLAEIGGAAAGLASVFLLRAFGMRSSDETLSVKKPFLLYVSLLAGVLAISLSIFVGMIAAGHFFTLAFDGPKPTDMSMKSMSFTLKISAMLQQIAVFASVILIAAWVLANRENAAAPTAAPR